MNLSNGQGECGLDFFKNFSERDVQKAIFARQLQKAVEHKKPLVIHSRDAEEVPSHLLSSCEPANRRLNTRAHMNAFAGCLSLVGHFADTER